MKPNAIKFFIYARKSTKGDDRQALSIGSQLQALERLVEEQGLVVVDRIIERESAHAPGRPQFNEMMRRIDKGEAAGIVAWHPDRLSRNSKDGGEIIYFLDIGKLVDLKFSTFWFENTTQGKANLGHELVQTKQYSDKLACDTKRGLQDKASMGFCPSKAPRGYVNDKAAKTILVDPQEAPIVKRAFELYAKGGSTLDDMQDFFVSEGILSKKRNRRQKGGLKVHHDWIRRFLRNPFYYGHFEYAGERYEGKHPPIISKSLFDEVQAVLARRTKHIEPERLPKAFLGLFRCGGCGMTVTAETQKGHIYYRCTRKSKTASCRQPFIREEALETELSGVLAPFVLRADWADQMLSMLETERRQLSATSQKLVAEKLAEIGEIAGKQQRLLSAYLEQLIDRDMFAAQKESLVSRKKDLQEQIKALEDNHEAWLEPFKKWILTAKNMEKTATTGTRHEKKVIAQKVFGSNLFLDSKKARGSSLKPWSFLQNPHDFLEMVRSAGVEPTTDCLEGSCSIQLSYERRLRHTLPQLARHVERKIPQTLFASSGAAQAVRLRGMKIRVRE